METHRIHVNIYNARKVKKAVYVGYNILEYQGDFSDDTLFVRWGYDSTENRGRLTIFTGPTSAG